MSKFQEIINGKTPVLLDFYATWCGPCKTMHPILDELGKKFEGKARILKIDVDKNQAAAAKFKIRGVPTFILFKEGEVLWRQSGAIPLNELEKVINDSL